MNTGSCLCREITFEVISFQPLIGHCHCSMCRKFHGAAFSTFAEVKLANLRWLTGEELLAKYKAENGSVRKFCRCCGSSLIFESQHNQLANTTEIALAAFDVLEDIKPDAHIFTQSKVEWITLNDDLVKYSGYRESL